jgi:hypothetical protein
MDRLSRLMIALNSLGIALLLCAEQPVTFAFIGLHPAKHALHDIDIALIGYFLVLTGGFAVLSWKMAMRQVRRDREARYERISLRHP